MSLLNRWQTRKPINGWLLATILALVIFGFVIFLSASVGLVARDSDVNFESIVLKQGIFLVFGFVSLYVLSKIPPRQFRKISFFLLLFSMVMCLLVFVPGLGFAHGGAKRWISLGSFTFQPSELLKIAAVVYFAAWLSMIKDKIAQVRWGMFAFIVILGLVAAILLSQPDIDTFVVVGTACLAMYGVAGARWKHIVWLTAIGLASISVLALMFPYVRSRMYTFVDPSRDSLGAGYQIQQSLIAVGSGGFFGRGFGKSVQKFNYLPEPMGDSVYAVASEEFGFVGSVGLLLLFFLFAQQGLRVALRTPDPFARYLAVGIVVMFLTQALINIGAMLGLVPLSGITLPFVSQGGSALLLTMAEAGILLSISRTVKT